MRSPVAVALLMCLAGCESNRVIVVNVNNINLAPGLSAPSPAQRVGQELRKIRVAEEAALVRRSGHPQPLPTGACGVIVTLGPGGTVTGAPLVHCDEPGLAEDVTKAIFAAAPFRVPPSLTQLHMHIGAPDMEPGIGEPAA